MKKLLERGTINRLVFISQLKQFSSPMYLRKSIQNSIYPWYCATQTPRSSRSTRPYPRPCRTWAGSSSGCHPEPPRSVCLSRPAPLQHRLHFRLWCWPLRSPEMEKCQVVIELLENSPFVLAVLQNDYYRFAFSQVANWSPNHTFWCRWYANRRW